MSKQICGATKEQTLTYCTIALISHQPLVCPLVQYTVLILLAVDM